nr:phage tail protein [Vibrio anguillarum]
TKPFYWKPYMPKVAGETMSWDTDTIPENMVVGIGQQLPKAVYHSLATAKPEWIDATDNSLINIPDRQGRFVRAADGTTWLVGQTHEDAIRNITGSVRSFYGSNVVSAGAMREEIYGNSPAKVGVIGGDPGANYTIGFDASRVVPTAAENQPKAFIEWVGYAL